MNVNDLLKNRRTIYRLKKEMPVSEAEVIKLVTEATALVPDSFDMKSQRVVIVSGEKQNVLWDTIYDVFGGKVSREKIDCFKAAHGTVLYFYDADVVKTMQKNVPSYAANFPVWAQQANGMLQISVWTGLRTLGVGANLQHYNPVIDAAVQKLFALPDNYVLVAQMPFGGIVEEPEPKAKEDITKRVKVIQD